MGEIQKFTPGPWKAEPNEKAANVCILGKRGDGDVRPSDGLGCLAVINCAAATVVDTRFAPMLPEQIANANLIAAAPDLYAALEQLESALMKDADDKLIAGDTVIYRLDGQAMYQAINQVRKALSAARGDGK